MVHHNINQEVELQINLKKHEKRKRQYKPKTKIQRLKSFFYIASSIGIFLQAVSCILASTGVINFVSMFLNSNGLIIISISVIALAGLELAYRKTLQEYNAQRLDDETKISPVIYVALFGLGSIYILSSYWGSPYAVQFFAAPPELNNLELIAMNEDNKIKKDSLFWANRVKVAQASKDSFLISNGKTDKVTGNWRIRSGSAKELQRKAKEVDKLNTSLTSSLASGYRSKDSLLLSLKADNKELLIKHQEFCSQFGYIMGLISVFCVLVFIPIFNWTEKYKRDETTENEILLAKYFNTEQKTEPKQKKYKQKKAPINQPITENRTEQEKPSIQIALGQNKNMFSEGDEVTENGEKKFFLLMQKGKNKGELIAKDEGQIKKMYNNLSNKNSDRGLFLNELLNQF